MIVTIYNQYEANDKVLCQRTVISGVEHVNGAKAITIGGKEIKTADYSVVYVPIYGYQAEKIYLSPTNWEKLTDKSPAFTFRNGDYVVIGESAYEVTGVKPLTVAGLCANTDAMKIISVRTLNYGSPSMQHWRIEVQR